MEETVRTCVIDLISIRLGVHLANTGDARSVSTSMPFQPLRFLQSLNGTEGTIGKSQAGGRLAGKTGRKTR